MKFICDRQAIHEALSAAGSVALSRTPKPILQCVRLTVEKDKLTLTAYDQEVGLRCHVNQIEVSQAGETLVPCDRLVAIVRESSDETMAFETKDELLHVKGKDSHFQIVTQDPREFPPVPEMEGSPDIVVQVGELKSAVEKTLFAAAKESTRYAINGVLWQKKNDDLKLVATDGRRLALSSARLENSEGQAEVEAIVPSKALSLLGKLHLDADETLKVRITPNQIIISCDFATISSVLVDGNFPNWQDVIPKGNDKELTLATGEFLSAVRRAALLANVESRGISLNLASNHMNLSSRSAEQGEAKVELDVDYTGSDLRIGFNPEFLIDALKVCDETTTLELKDSEKPGLIRSGTDFEYVVMPVNLS